jgi:hypothetical protein
VESAEPKMAPALQLTAAQALVVELR